MSDIFTSERSMALILRGHVNHPKKIVEGGIIHNNSPLKTALNEAVTKNGALNWDLPIYNWGDDEEEALATELLEALKAAWNPTASNPDRANFGGVNSYQWEGEPLSLGRNSFLFFTDGLDEL
jgi:hypothetical protein